MDRRTLNSVLAEAKTLVHFVSQGYDVFTQTSGKAPFDLVIHKERRTERVEVKSTATRNRARTGWVVQLKKVRHNRNVNNIVPFDKTLSDVLAIYIAPIDRVVVLETARIETRTAITIMDRDLEE